MSASTRKPRVAIVMARTCGFGGIESFLAASLPALAQQVDLHFVTTAVVAPSPFRDVLCSAGISLVEGGISDSFAEPIPERLRHRKVIARFVAEAFAPPEGPFNAIHVNCSWPWFDALAARTARHLGVKRILIHSHTDDPTPLSVVNRLRADAHRRTICANATHLLACSSAAGRSLFGAPWEREGIMVPNGIDTASFAFDPSARDKVRHRILRKRCGDDQTFVLGFVGRMSYQKYPEYAVDVLRAVLDVEPTAELWFVGGGELEAVVLEQAQSLGVSSHVRALGTRHDVPALLSGIDALIMPSRYEGLPVALLEAQASGVPCFVSDKVSREACMPGCAVTMLSTDDAPEAWARAIVEGRRAHDPAAHELVKAAGFDRVTTIEQLGKLYRGDSD